jgi:transposase
LHDSPTGLLEAARAWILGPCIPSIGSVASIPPSDHTLLKKIEAALSTEPRPHIRVRLKAVMHVLGGKTREHAAKRAAANPLTVGRWVKRARQSGLKALVDDGRARKRKKPAKPAAAKRARAEIAAALKTRHDPRTRARLRAVDHLLAGVPLDFVAREASVTPRVAASWLTKLERKGVAALLGKNRPPSPKRHLDADSARLRAIAAKETKPRIAKRIRAIAHLADGLDFLAAALKEGVHETTVRAWLADFRAGGVKALQHVNNARRP